MGWLKVSVVLGGNCHFSSVVENSPAELHVAALGYK